MNRFPNPSITTRTGFFRKITYVEHIKIQWPIFCFKAYKGEVAIAISTRPFVSSYLGRKLIYPVASPPVVPQVKYCTFCVTPASYDTSHCQSRIFAIGLNEINFSRYKFASHALSEKMDVLAEDDRSPLPYSHGTCDFVHATCYRCH